MPPAIRVDHLSKEYRIIVGWKHTDTLRDSIAEGVRSLVRGNGLRRGQERIWALRDVSFEIPRGEIVGIIGRNGAGKSTLLKILSRITHPTRGRAEIRGRVGSLLEVGTGFHPELTGRENVYLNGAIIGMRKREIDRKFDQIVEFSEIGQFIDTPVKRYSSGMSVRLAFSVAAHLEPEILLVDEVLAVGDAAFQRKCLGKMGSVAEAGRTVLFVSHNMAAVQNLCRRGIVIRGGQVLFDGAAVEAVATYLQQLSRPTESPFGPNPDRRGTGGFVFTSARVLDGDGRETAQLVAGEPAVFEFTYENQISARQIVVHFTLYNHLGTAVANFNTNLTGYVPDGVGSRGRFLCRIPNLPLPLGQYRGLVAAFAGGRMTDNIPNAVLFEVGSSTYFPTGRTPETLYATALVEHAWHHRAEEA